MLSLILLVAALICAILAAIGVQAPRVHLGWIAIALYLLSLVLGQTLH